MKILEKEPISGEKVIDETGEEFGIEGMTPQEIFNLGFNRFKEMTIQESKDFFNDGFIDGMEHAKQEAEEWYLIGYEDGSKKALDLRESRKNRSDLQREIIRDAKRMLKARQDEEDRKYQIAGKQVLKDLRGNISQAKLAFLMGREQQYIYKIEHGQKKIDPWVLDDYSQALNISIADIHSLIFERIKLIEDGTITSEGRQSK